MSENTFSYTYNAAQQQEVLSIRKKYLPRQETRLEELKRLDRLVQTSGVTEALIAGVCGTLIFGFGMCLAMEVIGNSLWLGVAVGLVGAACMLAAYPVYRKVFEKTKSRYAPRILELAAELTSQ